MTETRFHIPQLDGLRFIAFLLVFLSHFPDAASSFPDGSGWLIARIQKFGWIGVDLFLVLSSYLIFSLMLREHAKTGGIAFGPFYFRRLLRIWPLYFAYITFGFFVLTPALGLSLPTMIRDHALPFYTFLGNFSYATFLHSLPFHLAHLWTICLEEQFYLFAPVIGLALCWGRPRALMAFCCAVAVFTVAWRSYFVLNGIQHPFAFVTIVSRLDPFIVGAICAVAHYRRPEFFKTSTGLAGAAAAIAGWVLISEFPQVGASAHTIWQLTIVALLAGGILIAALSLESLGRVLRTGPIRYLGKISYGLYVYHVLCLVVGPMIFQAPSLLGSRGALSWTLDLLALLIANIFIASVSYFVLERSFLKFKERFEVVRSRPA